MKTNFVSPEAYIAVGKNRQKIYGNNTVYLSNKQEFEFEFFNPTKDNVMTKISINGKLISNRGLILRPGVRGWIERYIEENRKFLFETYSVEGNSEAVKKAIEDNGNIKIEFFKEKQKPIVHNFLNLVAGATTVGTSTRGGSCCTYDAGVDYSYKSCSVTDSEESLVDETLDFAPEENERGFSGSLRRRVSKSKSAETGRVEKGSYSGQHFTEVDMDFEYLPFHTINYKLMPVSQKPAEFNDLKLKCKKCGTKVKSNWKVCPICANPIENDCQCSRCKTKVEPAWKVCPMCGEIL